MTLETVFRRLTLLPGFIQTGDDRPRKAHWLGDRRRQSTPPQPHPPGTPPEHPPRPSGPRGYRDLASLTLGEVEEAIQAFRSQLVPSPVEGWLAKNYFCELPLRRHGDRPPLVFGRVKTIYPYGGHVHNMEEMELHFPRPDGPPDVLHLRDEDVSRQKPTQSYCVGVKFYVSEEELGDFRAAETIFIERGFAPLYETTPLELLDLNAQKQTSLPWLYVIGSGWFASIPDSVQPEIREQLHNLVRRGHMVLNYHPKRYALRHLSLNDELDFQYGFSEHYLVMPQNTEQTLGKLDESFTEIFMQP